MSALTLGELIDTLVAARRAGGFRYDGQARVLGQRAVNAAAGGLAKVVKVEFAGVVKSAWK